MLDAAWRRIEAGDRARLEDIAADAGVSRQTVYLHFESRAGLLLALVEHIDQQLGVYEQITRITAIEDPVEQLLATVTLTAELEPKVHGVAMALYRSAATDPEIARAFDDRMEHRRLGLRAALSRVAAAGLLTDEWPVADVVDLLWEASSPSSYDHLVGDRGWTQDRFRTWVQHLARSFVADR